MSTLLLIGATGGIGKQTLVQLLEQPSVAKVKVLVRTPGNLPEGTQNNPKVDVVRIDGVEKISPDEMVGHVRGCDAVILALGHNLTFHGMFLSSFIVLDTNKSVNILFAPK